MLLNCGVGEDSWESLGLEDQTSQSYRRSVLNIHWKDWCWSWNFTTLATWCEELPHWKRPWCWERLRAGGDGDNRGWDGWMASLTQWTWVGDGQGGLACCGSQGHKESDTTERLNWTEHSSVAYFIFSLNSIPLYEWTTAYWSIQNLTEGHLGCSTFWPLWIKLLKTSM